MTKKSSEYSLQDLDELYGYMWLKSDDTNIDADIFIDDGGAYIRDKHVPLLFLRNGKGRGITEFIPVSISDMPEILDKNMVIKISDYIIKQVFDFIKINKAALLAMANSQIDVEEFASVIKIPSYEKQKNTYQRVST